MPPALCAWLVSAGHIAEHVIDVGMSSASDADIRTDAVNKQAAIITKDGDFAQQKMLTGRGPTVNWIRLLNTRQRALLD